MSLYKRVIGDVNLIAFWENHWIGNEPLKKTLSIGYIPLRWKNKILFLWRWFNRVGIPLSDEKMRAGVEAEQWSIFHIWCLHFYYLRMQIGGFGHLMVLVIFFVGFARSEIDKNLLIVPDTVTRWCRLTPIKVNVFIWRLFWNKLPSWYNLSQRGIEINSILCPICMTKVETTTHLFFECDLAKDLVKLICNWWNVQTPTLFSFQDWFDWFDTLHLSSICQYLLEAVFFTLWWSIWCFRNTLLFVKVKPRKCLLFDKVMSDSFIWTSNRCRRTNVNSWL